jgi:hypothetical protein
MHIILVLNHEESFNAPCVVKGSAFFRSWRNTALVDVTGVAVRYLLRYLLLSYLLVNNTAKEDVFITFTSTNAITFLLTYGAEPFLRSC